MTEFNSTAKSFQSVCSCRGCYNTSTIQIQIPINEKLACTLNICNECLPKFSIPDRLVETPVLNEGGKRPNCPTHHPPKSSQMEKNERSYMEAIEQ